jgi:hypothetical protein
MNEEMQKHYRKGRKGSQRQIKANERDESDAQWQTGPAVRNNF